MEEAGLAWVQVTITKTEVPEALAAVARAILRS